MCAAEETHLRCPADAVVSRGVEEPPKLLMTPVVRRATSLTEP